MSKGLIPTTVVIFSCPLGQISSVDGLLAGAANWQDQSLLPGSLKTQIHLKQTATQTEDLVSSLNKLGSIHAEVISAGRELGTLFFLAPGLGIYRAETNQAGEILLSEDRIRAIVDGSGSNHKELQRLLRLALGQAWDDLLEPFRAANFSDNVVLFNKAV